MIKRRFDEFHRIKLDPQIESDHLTVYNLEEVWQLNTDNCYFNVVLEKDNERDYRLFIQYTKLNSMHYRKMNYSPSQWFSTEMEQIEFFRKSSIKELPREINDLIVEFLFPVKIAFQFRLSNDEHYPFTPSNWEVERYFYYHANHILAKNYENYETYHKHQVKESKAKIRQNWSPAITIDKQILSFISNLNLARIAEVIYP